MRKILLHGASEFKVSKLVDLYHVVQTTGSGTEKKRKKVRPSIARHGVDICRLTLNYLCAMHAYW